MTQSRHHPVWGLLGLIAANLFLLSIQVRDERGNRVLRNWVVAAVSPFAEVFHAGVSWLGETAEFLDRLARLDSENRRLRDENWRLQIQLHRLENLYRQWRADEGFRALASRFEYRVLRTAVIQARANPDSLRIWINVGRRDGVEADLPVIVPEGVVGRVVLAGPTSSEVELLLDPSAAAGARLTESGAAGIAEGTGGDYLLLRYLPQTVEVWPGEEVVTSGTDGIYPPGLVIGRVIDRFAGGTGTFQEVRVEPAVRPWRLAEVAVILWKEEGE
ncbi:MAG: hypothetical protein Kow00109_27660 [Acidobacteriota bacterium]